MSHSQMGNDKRTPALSSVSCAFPRDRHPPDAPLLITGGLPPPWTRPSEWRLWRAPSVPNGRGSGAQ
eukprot:4628435-Alexandrium_andersonii.AAC.1